MRRTQPTQGPGGVSQLKAYFVLLALFWTAVVAGLIAVSIAGYRREMITIAKNVARASIDKDMLFRQWVAMNGGVYVPVTEMTPPNPNLSPVVVPERDITTPSGRELTFVNPAYLTRQLYDLALTEGMIAGRITSRKPLNRHNKADPWEEKALEEFEKGVAEASIIFTEGDQRSLRLMRPLVTQKSCLPCHRQQGYREGDIRGGISVKLPMVLFEPAMHSQTRQLWIGHGILWLFGLTGLYAGYGGLKRRIGERDRAEEELCRVNAVLQDQATTDTLTGIANRRKFLELLEADICECKRYNRPLALIFFDIDHFKDINDTFGHEAGDQVLSELARIVGAGIRQSDIFARFGGEEFVILVHNNDVVTGREVADKVRCTVEQHDFPGVDSVTCSFGVAQLSSDDTAKTFIARGDEAMYLAKQRGRNRVEIRCVPSPG